MDKRKPKIKLPPERKLCRRCGWQWEARKQNPVECPACKSRKWGEK